MLARDDGFEYAHAGQRWSAPRTVEALAHGVRARPERAHRRRDDRRRACGSPSSTASSTTSSTSATSPSSRPSAKLRPALEIGAAVSLTDAVAALDRVWPELHEAWQRFASVPIRNSATLGGNVANGSPIGDSMPALMALDASVVLRSAAGEREVALDAFYPGYRQTARAPGEFVAAVRIPPASCRSRASRVQDQQALRPGHLRGVRVLRA